MTPSKNMGGGHDGQDSAVPEPIKKYLHGLLVAKGGDNLPGELQGRIMADLFFRFSDYLIANAMKAMTPEKRNEFEDVVETDDKEKIETFLKENTDYPEVVRETCREFREVFLGEANSSSGTAAQ